MSKMFFKNVFTKRNDSSKIHVFKKHFCHFKEIVFKWSICLKNKKKMFSLLFLRDLNFCKKKREEEEERNVFQDKCDLPRWSFLLKKKKCFSQNFQIKILSKKNLLF